MVSMSSHKVTVTTTTSIDVQALYDQIQAILERMKHVDESPEQQAFYSRVARSGLCHCVQCEERRREV